MAKGRAVAIVLDDVERRELTALTRKHGAPQAVAERARIVLAAAGGLKNKEIASNVEVGRHVALDLIQEFAELARAMAGHALADNGPAFTSSAANNDVVPCRL